MSYRNKLEVIYPIDVDRDIAYRSMHYFDMEYFLERDTSTVNL